MSVALGIEGDRLNLAPVTIPARPRGLKFELSALADARFDVRAEAATIEIFAVIGLDVTPARVAAALRQIGNRQVVVQINSPGGDPFDGLAIFNLLRGHAGGVVTQVLGIAASAASLVALAGERVEIARAAQIMIHRASAGVVGDADTMRTMAAALDGVDATLAEVYQARTGLPLTQIRAMMADETFMQSGEAIELGFADTLLDRDAAPAPRIAASAALSKRELDAHLRGLGLSRAVAARMVAEAYPGADSAGEHQRETLDFDAIARVLADNTAALTPRQRYR